MSSDAVHAAPHVYKVLLENDRVRVLEVRGNPGDSTDMHSHRAMVAISITDSTFSFRFPDGQQAEATLKAGEAMFLDPVEHETEIRGGQAAHAILIELK
jgi:hypothetical protein